MLTCDVKGKDSDVRDDHTFSTESTLKMHQRCLCHVSYLLSTHCNNNTTTQRNNPVQFSLFTHTQPQQGLIILLWGYRIKDRRHSFILTWSQWQKIQYQPLNHVLRRGWALMEVMLQRLNPAWSTSSANSLSEPSWCKHTVCSGSLEHVWVVCSPVSKKMKMLWRSRLENHPQVQTTDWSSRSPSSFPKLFVVLLHRASFRIVTNEQIKTVALKLRS